MKKILLCLLLLFSLNGCVQTHAWKYTSETKKYTSPTTTLEVIVPPMRDIRKTKMVLEQLLGWG